jgi:hypothetical protein
MSNTNTGGPAFPQFVISNFGAHVEGGMTLRDYFAAKAMQGLIASGSTNAQEIGQASFIVADAMLKAREA